jgi:hypothetical protein
MLEENIVASLWDFVLIIWKMLTTIISRQLE